MPAKQKSTKRTPIAAARSTKNVVKNKAAPPKPTPAPKPLPADLAKQLAQSLNAILALKTSDEDNHWKMGDLYNQAQAAAKAKGFDAQAWFAHNLHAMPASTLYRYADVSKGFSETLTKKYTMTCLQALLMVCRANSVPLPKGDPGAMSITVPDKGGGATQTKPFSQCSVAELNRAAHAGTPKPTVDYKLGQLVDQKLVEYFGEGTNVRCEYHRHSPTEWLFTFKNVNNRGFQSLAGAITDAAQEAGEPQD